MEKKKKSDGGKVKAGAAAVRGQNWMRVKARRLETRGERCLLLFCTLKITSATSAKRVHVERSYSVWFRLYNLPIHSLAAQQKTYLKRNET